MDWIFSGWTSLVSLLGWHDKHQQVKSGDIFAKSVYFIMHRGVNELWKWKLGTHEGLVVFSMPTCWDNWWPDPIQSTANNILDPRITGLCKQILNLQRIKFKTKDILIHREEPIWKVCVDLNVARYRVIQASQQKESKDTKKPKLNFRAIKK